MKDKVLHWLANGEVGSSSKAMAFCFAGVDCELNDHPHDPSDFNRCLLFLDAVSATRVDMRLLRGLSRTWSRFVDHWDEIETCFLDEAGFNWCKANKAPKTYALIKSVIAQSAHSDE